MGHVSVGSKAPPITFPFTTMGHVSVSSKAPPITFPFHYNGACFSKQ